MECENVAHHHSADFKTRLRTVSLDDGPTDTEDAADVERYVVSAPPATTNRGFEGVTLRPDVGAAGQFIVWNALDKLGAVATDLAAVAFDVSSSTLLVLSQESSRLLRVAPETGEIRDQRALSGSPQYEGVTLADGRLPVLVSEPNYVEVYQPK